MLGYDLPEEVLEEIFSWLPPASLIRFKCASKSWYTLINSLLRNSEFVNKHLRNTHTTSTSTCLVFGCFSNNSRFNRFKSVTLLDDDDDDDDVNYVGGDFYFPALPRKVVLPLAFRRHCNGIICIARFGKIMLCNPAIRERRILPKPRLDPRGYLELQVAFGYDSRSNDFKVARFVSDKVVQGLVENSQLRCEVYSLRSDSWREIGIQPQFNPDSSRNVVSCKGVFYWFPRTQKEILSFDMSDEVFHNIRLPSNLHDDTVQLGVWNESIVLFVYKKENMVTSSIEIWVTDNCSGGVNGSFSWIRKLIVRPPVKIKFIWDFVRNDELLMKVTATSYVLYNLRSQKLRNLTFEYPIFCADWDFSYVKSLFSVR